MKNERSGSTMMLRYYIEECGIGYDDLAHKIGEHRSYITKCVYGGQAVSTRLAIKLAGVLGFDYEDFLLLQYREKIRRVAMEFDSEVVTISSPVDGDP